jgi:two-component sensor histidine kinase
VGDGITLDLARAVPLGLLLNELVLNTCKHAFPADAAGELEIRLNEVDGDILVQVKDTGAGIRVESDYQTPATFGLQLVHMLAKQLGGGVMFRCAGGTTVDVSVPRRPANA